MLNQTHLNSAYYSYDYQPSREYINIFQKDDLNSLKNILVKDFNLNREDKIPYLTLSDQVINLTRSVNNKAQNITKWLLNNIIDNKDEIKKFSDIQYAAFKNDYIIALSKSIKQDDLNLIKLLVTKDIINIFPYLFSVPYVNLYSYAITQSLENGLIIPALYLCNFHPIIFSTNNLKNYPVANDVFIKLKFLSNEGFEDEIRNIFESNSKDFSHNISELYDQISYISKIIEIAKLKDMNGLNILLNDRKYLDLTPNQLKQISQKIDDGSFVAKEIIKKIEKQQKKEEVYLQ